MSTQDGDPLTVNASDNTQRVKVYIRLRPSVGASACVSVQDAYDGNAAAHTSRPSSSSASSSSSCSSLVLEKPSRQGDTSTTRRYTFDGVLDQGATQADVYREVAQPIVDDVLEGYNGTILAYGQTGAGKTHTLSSIEPAAIGIIPRAAQDLFGEHGDMEVVVKLSYLQIYCEQIQDLLKPETGDNLSIREFREGPWGGGAGRLRVGVPELQETVVTCLDDCLRLIQLGNRNRSVAFTDLNATSSRSHAVVIFTVTTTRTRRGEDGAVEAGGLVEQKTGRLYLVDLAGSERLKKSKSVAQRAVEARAINLSLTTLGKCVHARATGKVHVPFRDSKLTRLLQESLGGNAKTSMIVAVRVDGDHGEETFQSLEFGSRAMHVRTHAQVNISGLCGMESPGGSMGSPAAYSWGTNARQTFEKLQRDAQRNDQMLKELRKDQERSRQVIESLEREKHAMVRAARELRDAHDAERSEKDAYRNRALEAERRAIEAEIKASRNEAKVVELREQLDRAMEQLDDALEKENTSGRHLQQLVDLQAEHKQLLQDHACLQEELVASKRDTIKYKRRAKEAAFKLDILLANRREIEAKTTAAITIQRAFRAHRARQRRAKVQELARTKDALGQLAAKHAAGERVSLGQSLEVLQEAVEGILETFVFVGDARAGGLPWKRKDSVTRPAAVVPPRVVSGGDSDGDLIPAAFPTTEGGTVE